MSAEYNHFPESDDYLYFLSTLICGLIVNVLAVIHIRNVYLDLFTPQRASLAHRVMKPRITPLYRAASHMTWFCIVSYGVTEIIECIKQGPSGPCRVAFYVIMFFWNWSKSALFSVYFLRLETTYGSSVYAYPKWIIYGGIALQWVFGIILPILCNIYSVVFFYDTDGFPDPCWGVFANWNIIWIMVWDFGMNGLCLVAFIIPLYRVLSTVVTGPGNTASKRRMQHVAIKVTILTFTSSLTTIVGLALYTAFTFGHVFPYDWLMNSICLMLMTPYYADEKYYNRLCGVCIMCCFAKYKEIALEDEASLYYDDDDDDENVNELETDQDTETQPVSTFTASTGSAAGQTNIIQSTTSTQSETV